MELVNRNQINTALWDKKIASSPIENVFQYSWYLDAVCKNWSALITNNYQTILPIPFTQKFGIKQFIQAPFTREYDIIGNDFNWQQAIQFLSTSFKNFHFRNAADDIFPNAKKRQHQWLDLDSVFENNYSTNAKRILKKADAFLIETSTNTNLLIELFTVNVAHKVDTISKRDLTSLKKLMDSAIQKNHGDLLIIKENEKIVAAGFFLKDKKRIIYLKGAANEAAKKNGAMYFLLDTAMKNYRHNYNYFDFGGSEIDNVAEFYHKFGAQNRIYYDYTINDLPNWFKTLKKIKR